jgi:hypothetical protein
VVTTDLPSKARDSATLTTESLVPVNLSTRLGKTLDGASICGAIARFACGNEHHWISLKNLLLLFSYRNDMSGNFANLTTRVVTPTLRKCFRPISVKVLVPFVIIFIRSANGVIV